MGASRVRLVVAVLALSLCLDSALAQHRPSLFDVVSHLLGASRRMLASKKSPSKKSTSKKSNARKPPPSSGTPPAPPATPAGKCTVTLKGGANLQAAIDGLPASGGTVCLGAGRFNGQIKVNKPGVTLQGQGVGTRITGSLSQSKTGNVWLAGTVLIQPGGNNFRAQDLVIENTVVTKSNPSPALIIDAPSTTFVNCRIEGWHDTLGLKSGSHLFKNCYISGRSDYIWGHGRGGFVNCEIFTRNLPGTSLQSEGAITALGTQDKGPTAGAVFEDCSFTGQNAATLGRPYRPSVIIAVVRGTLGPNIEPMGWSDYKGNLFRRQADLREYGSKGPGARPRRLAGQVFNNGNPPSTYTVRNFIGRTN